MDTHCLLSRVYMVCIYRGSSTATEPRQMKEGIEGGWKLNYKIKEVESKRPNDLMSDDIEKA